jgi:hypothetical protein
MIFRRCLPLFLQKMPPPLTRNTAKSISLTRWSRLEMTGRSFLWMILLSKLCVQTSKA